jgi:hypothetical protein
MIRWGEPIPTEAKKIRDIYRETFSSGTGKKALLFILSDLGFFDQTSDETSQALRNFAVRLLEQMGMLHENNAEVMVDQLFKLEPYDIQTHREIGAQEDN